MDPEDDGRLRSIGTAALAATWAAALYGIITLPATVPQSWNLGGQIQAYGSKWALLILPLVATVTVVVIRALRKLPRIPLNLPFDVPEDRLGAVDAVARKYLEVVAAALSIGFALLEAALVHASATGDVDWTFGASVATILILTFGTAAAMLVQIYRAARA